MLARQLSTWVAIAVAAGVVACGTNQGEPGEVLDEATRAHVKLDDLIPRDLPDEKTDYFNAMDGGLKLSPQARLGRAMWLVWTGGNDRFWDLIGTESAGTLDYLKTVSSHPPAQSAPAAERTYYGRHNRWNYLGLVNEPCFREATGPDPNRYGLWLDVREPGCDPDPFANAQKYKGIEIGARGKTVPVGSYYGEPSGIVGFRLFPNPAFDEKARKRWNSERYYTDPDYYNDRNLVRPYRVGMSCALCHVGPNPVKPPADPENPKWENLSSNVGAQYFWVDRIFNWRGTSNEGSFFYQLFHTSRPGTLDTSLVSTDNINNPRSMNAVYYLMPRMTLAKRFGKERLAGGETDNRQFSDFVGPENPLAGFSATDPSPGGSTGSAARPNITWTPRVLKDGSDSVGALGALNRVYINIGLFSEEWLLHFRALIGGKPITPIRVKDAQRNSVYWRATEQQTLNMALFFLSSTDPHHLEDAPGGRAYLTEDAATLGRGKTVFAERCARCHSSKLPDLPPAIRLGELECAGPGYLNCWNQYWGWTKTEEFKTRMREIVRQPDFLRDNYLSNELRIPVTLLQTNACSPLATNAIRGNIWDDFSSDSYKELPSVGEIEIRHPLTGQKMRYPLPAGGRGYTRPASLVSLWSTAPFLLNNTVGHFEPSPSVEARMRSFQDSIEQMLWPEKRQRDPIFTGEYEPGTGVIDRTTADSTIRVAAGYVPDPLRPLLGLGPRLFPFLFGQGGSIELPKIPKGTPVGLLANLDLLDQDASFDERRAHFKALLDLLDKSIHDLKGGRNPFADPGLVDRVLAVSKCKDLVVNKGHYFGTKYLAEEPGLSDEEKRALIGFLKTL